MAEINDYRSDDVFIVTRAPDGVAFPPAPERSATRAGQIRAFLVSVHRAEAQRLVGGQA